MNVLKIVIVVFSFLMVSCEYNRPSTLAFKQEFVDSIKSFIDRDSIMHCSYLILHTDKVSHDRKIPNGYLIGPLYDDLSPTFKKYESVILFSNKKITVYLYHIGAEFIQESSDSIKFCKQDSILICDTIYIKSPIINFLKRANLFYYKDGMISVRGEVDTLFMRKLSVYDPI